MSHKGRRNDKNAKKGLTAEQIEEIRDVFKLIDEDGSGRIDVAELRVAWKMILDRNIDMAEAETEMAKYDKDGDLEIDFPEFLLLMKNVVAGMNMQDQAVEQFKKFADMVGDRPRAPYLKREGQLEDGDTVDTLRLSWLGLKDWANKMDLNCQDEELAFIMKYLAKPADDEGEEELNPLRVTIDFKRFLEILDETGVLS